jgi:hypothetical protein
MLWRAVCTSRSRTTSETGPARSSLQIGLVPGCNREHHFHSSIGKYLQPEPMLQNPNYIKAITRKGRSGPVYGYALDNPIGFADPDGRLVNGIFDCKSGKLMLWDLNTGQMVTINASSGGNPFGAPIPDGVWNILQARQNGFYRLDAEDSKPNNDIYEPTGRSRFRLHRPGRTTGCIAADDWNGWNQANELLQSTETDTVPDYYQPPWWHPWGAGNGQPITRYGEIEVVGCGG